KKPVAGMDRLGAAHACCLDYLFRREIAFAHRGRADANGLVGHCDMQGAGVSVGVDGDSANAHAARGSDDPAGDLAAIGDKDFREHGPFYPPLVRGERAGPRPIASAAFSASRHGPRTLPSTMPRVRRAPRAAAVPRPPVRWTLARGRSRQGPAPPAQT